jgi:lysophospholipase L1-like esterase
MADSVYGANPHLKVDGDDLHQWATSNWSQDEGLQEKYIFEFINLLENYAMDYKIQTIFSKEEITLDFVGDSVTEGTNHCLDHETYVARFAYYLSRVTEKSVYRYDRKINKETQSAYFDGPVLVKKGEKGKIDIIRNGEGGNTVTRAHNRIDDFTGTLCNGMKPDVTFTMFGINDALKSDPQKYVSPDTYKENYRNLINEIKRRNPDTVIVMISASYNDQCVDEYCARSKLLALEEGIPYIDLHKLWADHYDPNEINFGQGDWLNGGTDACHPTPKGADETAKFIFNEFIELVGGLV